MTNEWVGMQVSKRLNGIKWQRFLSQRDSGSLSSSLRHSLCWRVIGSGFAMASFSQHGGGSSSFEVLWRMLSHFSRV